MTFETKDLVVRYPGTASPVLDGVTMTVPEGALYAVLGPNGSGKSTLLKALMGVIPVAAGSALVGGRPASSWKRREMARAVGAVAQSETLTFPLTVRELVAMGRYAHQGALSAESPHDRRAIDAALEACDVTELAERDATTLSGGELQRVRIARALAQEPSALVLDEPTASLDIRHEMAILELLEHSARRGITVLLITHGLDLAARYADRMLLLDRGRVAAEGAPGKVLDARTLSDVYGWPVAVTDDHVTGVPRVIPLGRTTGSRTPVPPS